MSKSAATTQTWEQTPVDDVRLVRNRISRESGGDIHRQIKESRRVAESYRDTLGLKTTPAPRVRGKRRHRSGKSKSP